MLFRMLLCMLFKLTSTLLFRSPDQVVHFPCCRNYSHRVQKKIHTGGGVVWGSGIARSACPSNPLSIWGDLFYPGLFHETLSPHPPIWMCRWVVGLGAQGPPDAAQGPQGPWPGLQNHLSEMLYIALSRAILGHKSDILHFYPSPKKCICLHLQRFLAYKNKIGAHMQH